MNGYRLSVLVVDDEPAIRGLLRDLLAEEFTVTVVGSAEEALDRLAGQPFDVILADQQLPGQSGVQLLEHVCRRAPHSIRILMTGLGRLEDAVDAINCGRVHRYLFKPFKTEQLRQTLALATRTFLLERSHEQLLDELKRLNADLERRVQQRTTELEEANRQLQQRNNLLTRMALTDALTGMPNRRMMDRLARAEMNRRLAAAQPIAIGLIDADHFKDINSAHLLSGGDHALAWLGKTLTASVRTADTVGRVGGEEFMVLAPETAAEGAKSLAERIRHTVERGSTQFNGQTIRMTVSVGFAVAAAEVAASYEQLRHAAASALSAAKRGGRNRSVVRVLKGAPSR